MLKGTLDVDDVPDLWRLRLRVLAIPLGSSAKGEKDEIGPRVHRHLSPEIRVDEFVGVENDCVTDWVEVIRPTDNNGKDKLEHGYSV